MVRTVSLDEYTRLHGKNHHWLIRGFVPKPALLLLLGEAKSGKTSLAFNLALALGQGGTFLGHQAAQSRVLFLQFDMSEFILRTMLNQYKTMGVSLDGDIFLPHPEDMRYSVNIMAPEYQAYLRELKESRLPDVVFLDVLTELHSNDEQSSIAMKEVLNKIMDIFGECTIVLIHHTKKPNRQMPINPVTASRGTSYVPGRADSIWLLDEEKLYITGRLGPSSVTLLRRLPSGLWTLR